MTQYNIKLTADDVIEMLNLFDVYSNRDDFIDRIVEQFYPKVSGDEACIIWQSLDVSERKYKGYLK